MAIVRLKGLRQWENYIRESNNIHRYRVDIYMLLCAVFLHLGEFSGTFVMDEVRKL